MDIAFTPGRKVAFLPQYLLVSMPQGVAAEIVADTGRNRFGDRTCTLRLLEDAPGVSIPAAAGVGGFEAPAIATGTEIDVYDRQVREPSGRAILPARRAVVEMTDTMGNEFVIMPSSRGGWTLAGKSGTPNSFGNLFDRGAMVEAMLNQCDTADEVLAIITANARRYLSGPKKGEFTSLYAPRLVTA